MSDRTPSQSKTTALITEGGYLEAANNWVGDLICSNTPFDMEDAQDYGRAIKVTMLMFGPLAEKMGTREIEVNMPDGQLCSNSQNDSN